MKEINQRERKYHNNYVERKYQSILYAVGKRKQKKKAPVKGIKLKIIEYLKNNKWNIEKSISEYSSKESKLVNDTIYDIAKGIIEENIETLTNYFRENDEAMAIEMMKKDIESDYIPKDWIWVARKNILEEMLLKNLNSPSLTVEQYLREKLPSLEGNDLGKNILERITEKIAVNYRIIYGGMIQCLAGNNYDVESAVEDYLKKNNESVVSEDKSTETVESSISSDATNRQRFKSDIKAEDASKERFLTYVAECINNKIKDLLKEYMSDLNLSLKQVRSNVLRSIKSHIPNEWIDYAKLYRFRAYLNNGHTMQDASEEMKRNEIIGEDFLIPNEWIEDAKYNVIKPRLFKYLQYPNIYDNGTALNRIIQETGIEIDEKDTVVVGVRNAIILNKILEYYNKAGDDKKIDDIFSTIESKINHDISPECKNNALCEIAKDLTERFLSTEEIKTFTIMCKRIKEKLGIEKLDENTKNIIRETMNRRQAMR